MDRKFFNLALIISLAIGVALAQQPALTNAPSVERLRAHIEYLASDKLEGRRTGSPGANLAAEYIAREFARSGLRRSIGYDTPGMSHFEADSPRRYTQEFPYVAGVELGKANKLSFSLADNATHDNLRIGDDWMPVGSSSNGQIERGTAVFVGFGITAPELKYDEYSIVDARGKIAFAFTGTPDGDNPHGQFARYEDPRWKAIAAKNAGAKALILISQRRQFADEPFARLQYNNSGGEAGLPVAIISSRAFFASPNESDLTVKLGLVKQGHMPTVTFKSPVTLFVDITRRAVPAYNVIGILDGSDPVLKNETIVIGAHYDHLGRGGEGSLAPKEGDIHHGADDNASGVAGVLELAWIFTAQRPRPRRTILFIAFSGEEEGLLGSNYYVNHPIIPLDRTVAMINMDMIGRMKNNKLIVGGVGTAQEWRNMIASENLNDQSISVAELANPSRTPGKVTAVIGTSGQMSSAIVHAQRFDLSLNEDGYGPSDHSSFYAKKVPVLFLWTGTHEDYHKPSDTADKINYEGEAQTVSFLASLIRDIDKSDKRPTYTVAKSESTGRSAGFRVYLGTIPNYADSNDGLLLDGVRDDSPASRAGLKAGDRIVKIAGREVHNVYDYTYALGEMKAGQEYEVELLRGSERLKLKITPAARK